MKPTCLLSIDLEEWSDARLAGIPAGARDELPRSLDEPVDRLLELLDRRRARATFFVVGRVARRYPALLRRIAENHEIATHGNSHENVPAFDPRRLAEDVGTSKRRIEDLAGRPVIGYRAPNFSLGPAAEWGLPVLEQEGIRYDSSLLPGEGFLFLRGSAGTPQRPYRVGRIWEFPPTVTRGPGFTVPATGGAFLRALPVCVVRRILHREISSGQVPHVYIHPWEFGRPRSNRLGLARRAILFAGSRTTPAKLSALLLDFQASPIGDLWRQLAADDQVTRHFVAGANA